MVFGILRSVELYLFTDVSESLLVPHFQESRSPKRIFFSPNAWPLKIVSPKRIKLTTILRCVISQKIADLIHTAAEALVFVPATRILARNTETGNCVLFCLSDIDLKNKTFPFKHSIWMWVRWRNSDNLLYIELGYSAVYWTHFRAEEVKKVRKKYIFRSKFQWEKQREFNQRKSPRQNTEIRKCYLISTHGTTRVTTHTCYSIAATTPELTIEILNSMF